MRTAVLPTEEHELSSISPRKRKYEESGAGASTVQLRLRQIKTVTSSALHNARTGFLFPTSDLLLQRGQGLVLVRDIMQLADLEDIIVSEDNSTHGIHAIIPSMCALNHLEGNWRELVGASRHGDVFSAVLDDDGHITTLLHEDLICTEKSNNELVTTIFHAGKHCFYYYYFEIYRCI
jgi:hypothetical protein